MMLPATKYFGRASSWPTKRGYVPVIRSINHGVSASPKLGRLGIRHQNAWIRAGSATEDLRDLGSRGLVDAAPAPVPPAMRIDRRDRGVDPVEPVAVMAPGDRAEHVELGEPTRRLRLEVALELDAMHRLRMIAHAAVQPARERERRMLHEIQLHRPADECLGRALPWSLAPERVARAGQHSWPAIADHVVGCGGPKKHAVGVDMTDVVRIAVRVGQELGRLLTEVIIAIVATQLDAGRW